MSRTETFTLNDKQQETIRQRMSQPREHVSREDIHSLLHKFNPTRTGIAVFHTSKDPSTKPDS